MNKETKRKQFRYAMTRGIGGNITVIVALLLPVMIGILLFAVDGGRLLMIRGRYEKGVEAAAMAGARQFSNGRDESELSLAIDTAGNVAEENGIPKDAVWVEIGYYDEAKAEFRNDTDPATEWNDALSDTEPVFNNAVRVTARNGLSTLFGSIFGKNPVVVSAQAVAFGGKVINTN